MLRISGLERGVGLFDHEHEAAWCQHTKRLLDDGFGVPVRHVLEDGEDHDEPCTVVRHWELLEGCDLDELVVGQQPSGGLNELCLALESHDAGRLLGDDRRQAAEPAADVVYAIWMRPPPATRAMQSRT